MFQNKLSDSVYSLIIKKIGEAGYEKMFEIRDGYIRNKRTGSEFLFYGLWRHTDEIKSIDGIDICFIEEAHNLTEDQMKVLSPTIRKEGSFFIIVFNPQNRLDFVFKNFIENPSRNVLSKKINYTDNPFVSQTMLDEIEVLKEEDIEKYEHIYLGYPTESSENSLFSYKDVNRAMHRKVTASGATIVGCDVGRVSDPSAVCIRKGLKVFPIQERQIDGEETAGWAIKVYNTVEADAIVVDTIGAGGTTYDIIRKVVNFAVDGNNAKASSNPDRFKNKRAESYWNLAEDVRKGLIELPDDDILAEELLATEYFFNTAGQIQIVDKVKVIKEMLGRSPNKADALALTYFQEIGYDSQGNHGIRDDYIAPNVF